MFCKQFTPSKITIFRFQDNVSTWEFDSWLAFISLYICMRVPHGNVHLLTCTCNSNFKKKQIHTQIHLPCNFWLKFTVDKFASLIHLQVSITYICICTYICTIIYIFIFSPLTASKNFATFAFQLIACVIIFFR
jgi:hypothetical protein